jgi:hypothetical protein
VLPPAWLLIPCGVPIFVVVCVCRYAQAKANGVDLASLPPPPPSGKQQPALPRLLARLNLWRDSNTRTGAENTREF